VKQEKQIVSAVEQDPAQDKRKPSSPTEKILTIAVEIHSDKLPYLPPTMALTSFLSLKSPDLNIFSIIPQDFVVSYDPNGRPSLDEEGDYAILSPSSVWTFWHMMHIALRVLCDLPWQSGLKRTDSSSKEYEDYVREIQGKGKTMDGNRVKLEGVVEIKRGLESTSMSGSPSVVPNEASDNKPDGTDGGGSGGAGHEDGPGGPHGGDPSSGGRQGDEQGQAPPNPPPQEGSARGANDEEFLPTQATDSCGSAKFSTSTSSSETTSSASHFFSSKSASSTGTSIPSSVSSSEQKVQAWREKLTPIKIGHGNADGEPFEGEKEEHGEGETYHPAEKKIWVRFVGSEEMDRLVGLRAG